MSNTITYVPLKKELVTFLWENGYSHFLSKGIIKSNYEADDSDDYILLPIKPGDLRHQFEEAELIISHFDSLDVQDMLLGTDGISFKVELSNDEFEKYQQIQ